MATLRSMYFIDDDETQMEVFGAKDGVVVRMFTNDSDQLMMNINANDLDVLINELKSIRHEMEADHEG